MVRRTPRRTLLQLHFFRPRPRVPRWELLPNDTRRKSLPLIASLLRQVLQAAKEVSNER